MCSEVVAPAEPDAADVNPDPDADDSDAGAEAKAGEEPSEAPGITTDTSGTSSTVVQPGQ
jgi:hypothetical protein